MTSNFVESAALSRFAGLIATGLIACLLALPHPLRAQTTEWSTITSQQQEVDPPGRVGRLSEVIGTAWLYHPDAGEWIATLRNRPVTSGDRLSTEAGARLELQVGSTTLRLDGNTDIEIGRIDDEAIEVHLQAGQLALRVRNDEAARDLLIATDDGGFSLLRSGSYRIERRDARSEITVWSGQAVYNGPQSALTVYHGQRAVFWLDASQRAQYSLGQPRYDTFASWNSERDRLSDSAVASRHVSPEMTGIDDLDRYGRWSEDPEYGALWAPHQVPSGWAPYAAGHWAWVSPWGWTWVDDAPWGFAPFHYGRWVVVDNSWRWAPGRRVARPVYAPALVGWVGGSGAHVSVTIGSGRGIGWFPLAPREPYVPSHRHSRDYVRIVNGPHFKHRSELDRVIHVTSVERGIEYRNRKFHHGTTTIPIEAFSGRGGDRGRIRVDPDHRGHVGRDLDRLPGSPVATAPPPHWLREHRERREMPRGRDGDRHQGRPFFGSEGPPHGNRNDSWLRQDRIDSRTGEVIRAPRDFDERGRAPRFDGGRGRQPDIQPSMPAVPAPVAPVVAAPIEPPRPIAPVQIEQPPQPPRFERRERPEHAERPFERGEHRGGRPDRSIQPPFAERGMVQAPAAQMPPQPQMPAQPNRRLEQPRMMPPAGDPPGQRHRDQSEVQQQERPDKRRVGGPGRGIEQP